METSNKTMEPMSQLLQLTNLQREAEFDRLLDDNFNEQHLRLLIEGVNAVQQKYNTGNPAVDAPASWQEIAKDILRPTHPPAVKELIYNAVYAEWDKAGLGPRPVWFPDEETLATSNIQQLMKEKGFATVEELHRWSIEHGNEFWPAMMQRLGINFQTEPTQLVDTTNPKEPKWFPGGQIDIASILFRPEKENDYAIIHQDEGGEIKRVTYGELDKLSNRFANALRANGVQKGEAIALEVTSGIEWVVSVIGAAKAGCPVWSIPNNFRDRQLDMRFEQMPDNVKLVITQDKTRDAKQHAIYENILACQHAPKRAVVAFGDEDKPEELGREGDSGWNRFLEGQSDVFKAEPLDSSHPFIVHFSSGTSNPAGEEKPPKAIAWRLDTLIKSAVDTHLMRDMHENDRMLWTTGPGWMMGSSVLWGSLLNGGAICSYGGSYTGEALGKFIETSGATIVGTIPSAVRQWRESRCMETSDFSRVRMFCSTGEPSIPLDQFYLMSLKSGFAPSIEGMGGTEIGGGYLSSLIVKPSSPSMFHNPAFGTEVLIAGKDFTHADFEEGEMAIAMNHGGGRTPPMGLSTRFENKPGIYNHEEQYFNRGATTETGTPLRQHGDVLKPLPGGYIQSDGRAGDSCNINGVKVSFASLEKCVREAKIPGITEVAFTALRPQGGGPDKICALYAFDSKIQKPESPALMKQMLSAIKKEMPAWAKIDYLFEVLPEQIRSGSKISHKNIKALATQKVSEAELAASTHDGQTISR